MASNEKKGHKSIKNRHKLDPKQVEIFLYGKIRYRARAIGYCALHKCYLDKADTSEKRCFYKHCKYLKEVN